MTTPLQDAVYKRRRARRGVYVDRNGTRHHYHSLMERQRMRVLDLAGLHFRREPCRIRYYWGQRWRPYVVDLAVYDEHGRLLRYEEIKPLILCTDEQNLAKWNAARKYCSGRHIGFRVICERNMQAL